MMIEMTSFVIESSQSLKLFQRCVRLHPFFVRDAIGQMNRKGSGVEPP